MGNGGEHSQKVSNIGCNKSSEAVTLQNTGDSSAM